MKNFSVRGQLLLGFGLVIAVFVISAIWVSMLFDQNVKNNKWTMHTYEVLLESRDLLAALINIETGQRGYLLAGEESFLAPLRQGEQDFELSFDRIKELTGDNPVQQERLQRLQHTTSGKTMWSKRRSESAKRLIKVTEPLMILSQWSGEVPERQAWIPCVPSSRT